MVLLVVLSVFWGELLLRSTRQFGYRYAFRRSDPTEIEPKALHTDVLRPPIPANPITYMLVVIIPHQ